jgi:hypothetical protein
MSKSQRTKGAVGERELFALLQNELGFVVKRNLAQTQDGGADTLDVPGWSIECKRVEKLQINSWWAQTLAQAELTQAKPILFYRQSRQPWRAVVRLCDVSPAVFGECPESLATILLPDACQLIRASLQGNLALENSV